MSLPNDFSPSRRVAELQRPELRPVFSVLVAGHREQRLSRHWIGNQPGRESALHEALKKLLLHSGAIAEKAFSQANDIYTKEYRTLRLITGQATGVDQMAASLSSTCGYQLTYLTAQEKPDENDGGLAQHVSLGMHASGIDESLSQDDYSLRDSLALSFADLLIAVWDTQEPLLITSGTARVIRTALLRRKPVLLLRLDPEDDNPQLFLNLPSSLTDAHLLELETLSCDAEALMHYFSRMRTDEQFMLALEDWMNLLLLPFMPSQHQDFHENQRLESISRQQSLLGFLYAWLIYLLRPRQTLKPPTLYQWLNGAQQWLQVMLNPPERSQSRRLLELLTRGKDTLSRREQFIGRLHLFFSAMARLSLIDFKAALSPRRPLKGYQHLIPEASEKHPIHEPDLEQVFNWAEAQAVCFGRRYRDGIWMIYYAAAFAVFCAVAGALSLWPATMPGLIMIWAVCEFMLLRFIVGHVLQARFRDWHGHWMSYRYLAEQLRYLRIGYPLLVFPQAFIRPHWGLEAGGKDPQLISAENWLLQRILITTGLPVSRQHQSSYCVAEHNHSAALYLQQVLDEHITYFKHSHANLHRDHVFLHRLAFALFFITFLAVTLHFVVKISWILIFTAFFPAWGAAIHGILSHNEVVRMSSLAGQVSGQLAVLNEACKDYQDIAKKRSYTSKQQRWRHTQELRALFARLSRILSDENQHWRSLNRHNQTDLPA